MPAARATDASGSVAQTQPATFRRRRRGTRFACGAALGWSRHDRGHTGDNMTLTERSRRRCCSTRRGDDGCLTGAGLGATQPEAGLDAREGLRHLARVHVGTDVGADRGRRPRVAGARCRTRRSGLDPLRGPSRVDHPRPGDRRRAGHHRRALPDQPDGGGRVPARRLRRQDPPRRGPGAGRQGRSRSTASGSPTSQRIIFVEPRGLVGADDDRLLFWDNFLELGREHQRAAPRRGRRARWRGQATTT